MRRFSDELVFMQIITTHLSADFDCLASMVAAGKLYPQATMVFSGSIEPCAQKYLKHFNFPFAFHNVKEIDVDKVELLVVVDTQDPGRIGPFQAILGKPGVEVHVYDHHLDVSQKIPAQKSVVKKRGSAATVLFEILREQGKKLSGEESSLLLLGIFQDTHSLASTSTTPEDFEAVAQLMRQGGDLSLVADFVQPRLNSEQVAVMNDLIRNLEVLNIAGVDVALASATVDNYVGELSVAVSKILEMENLAVLFALIRLDSRVYLIARSRSESVDVCRVVREFGGGGHSVAASACVKEFSLVQVREKLIALLEDVVKPPTTVGEIMHAPAISVAMDDTVQSVEKTLTRYNLNTLPVVSGKRVEGLITRQIVEKAIHHKMGKEPVREIMILEFSVAAPDFLFNKIVPAIIEDKQKIVPVVDPETEELQGIVSRGDLLRLFHSGLVSGSDWDRGLLGKNRSVPVKNIKSLIRERFPKRIVGFLGQMIEVADRMGVSIYAVGGFVRDLLLRRENLDVDVVVEGDGILFANALGKLLGGKVRSHAKFRTSVVILEDGLKIDVATARLEYYSKPAALPTVVMSSIKSDLFRRDFTVNSMAVKLNGKNPYTLVDYFNGQRDLKEKRIRVLHNLSFVEDPSRAFRAVRFEQRFGFVLGKQTEAFMKQAINKRLMDKLSGTRLFNELRLLLDDGAAMKCLRRLRELDLLTFIHPEVAKRPKDFEALERIGEALSWAGISPFPKQPDLPYLYLLGLLFPLQGKELDSAVHRLQIPGKMSKNLGSDLRCCGEAKRRLSENRQKEPSEVNEIFSSLTPEGILFLLAEADDAEIKKYALLYFSQYYSCEPVVLNGEDLIHLGLEPGPVFSRVFKRLRDDRLNGKIKTRQDEVTAVKNLFLDGN